MLVMKTAIRAGVTGFESPAAEYVQHPLSLDELLITHPSATLLCRVKGDDMQKIGVFDDDLVVCDRALTPMHEDIVIALVNGEYYCLLLDSFHKRLYSPHNTDVINIGDDTDAVIIGVVSSSFRCHHKIDI